MAWVVLVVSWSGENGCVNVEKKEGGPTPSSVFAIYAIGFNKAVRFFPTKKESSFTIGMVGSSQSNWTALIKGLSCRIYKGIPFSFKLNLKNKLLESVSVAIKDKGLKQLSQFNFMPSGKRGSWIRASDSISSDFPYEKKKQIEDLSYSEFRSWWNYSKEEFSAIPTKDRSLIGIYRYSFFRLPQAQV